MQRSSESIGVIAVALAKAQAEINPEKSFIGIIGPSSPQEPGRSFRYAPLSSGLDIVRKSLGRHAIARQQWRRLRLRLSDERSRPPGLISLRITGEGKVSDFGSRKSPENGYEA